VARWGYHFVGSWLVSRSRRNHVCCSEEIYHAADNLSERSRSCVLLNRTRIGGMAIPQRNTSIELLHVRKMIPMLPGFETPQILLICPCLLGNSGALFSEIPTELNSWPAPCTTYIIARWHGETSSTRVFTVMAREHFLVLLYFCLLCCCCRLMRPQHFESPLFGKEVELVNSFFSAAFIVAVSFDRTKSSLIFG
jgi:hypothetical protein